MKTTRFHLVWNVIYPVLFYIILSDCIYTVLTMVITEGTVSDMILQILTVLFSCPGIFFIYYNDRKTERLLKTEQTKRNQGNNRKLIPKMMRVILICFAAGLLAIALNNLILMTPLPAQSLGYQKATHAFFSSTLMIELLGTSVITPVVEEVLYRGLVYKRIRRFGRILPSVVLSAVIFGAAHFNLVQFLYAGLIGAFLAFVLETEQDLYAPVWAHAVANALSVLRVETGFLGWLTKENVFFLPISIVMLVIAGIIIWYIGQNMTSAN